MSWSNSWMGKAVAIKGAMDRYSAHLTGTSKEEFDAVQPHLAALLDQNTSDVVLHLDGSGHAYTNENGTRIASCSVTLRTVGVLVE